MQILKDPSILGENREKMVYFNRLDYKDTDLVNNIMTLQLSHKMLIFNDR